MEKQRTDLWLRWFSFSSHDRYFLSVNFFIVWLISISLFLLFIILRYWFHKTGSKLLYIWWKLWRLKVGNFAKTQFSEISVGFSFLFLIYSFVNKWLINLCYMFKFQQNLVFEINLWLVLELVYKRNTVDKNLHK